MYVITEDHSEEWQCPKCHSREVTSGPNLGGLRNYDILTDTNGHKRCKRCGYRAHAARFSPANRTP